jgi:hypothetical protein
MAERISDPKISVRRCFTGTIVANTLLAAWLLAHVSRAWSAGPAVDWVKLVTKPGYDRGIYCYAVAVDSKENIYVGSGPDLALSKFDSAGNLLWDFGLQPVIHPGILEVRGLAVDASDNLYAAGYVYGLVTFGSTTFNRNDPSLFIAKMTPEGSFTWVKFFFNLYSENKPFSRAADGTMFVGGTFYNTVTYEGITVSPTVESDVVVFKLNADGSPIWARRGAGTSYDYFDSVAATQSGGVVVVGRSTSSSFGMAGLITTGPGRYAIRINNEGTGEWIRNSPGGGDGVNEVSAVAHFRQTGESIWAGNVPGGGVDAFVTKLSVVGQTNWTRQLGGPGNQFINTAGVDELGSVYVAGFFDGQMQIAGQTFNSYGLEDIFVAKLNSDGTALWGKQIGWTAKDRTTALAFSPSGQLVIVGSASGGVSIDGRFLEGANPSDGFLAKLQPEGVPPRFTVHPQGRVVSAGMTLTLTTEAASDSNLAYQWWFNGARITGATNATLTITNTSAAYAGSYYVVARNAVTEVQSEAALISYTDAGTLTLTVHPSLTIFGTPGRTYRIEFATETRGIAVWTTATNLTLATTPQIWIDPAAALGEKRFYRVLLQ